MQNEERKTYSAFVIIPENKQESRFVWVMDRPDAREPHPKMKFPGGGVEGRETPEMTSGKEALEEVGLRIVDPAHERRLLEIHKRSPLNGNIPHCDIFLESDMPVNGTILKCGEEIIETDWASREEILAWIHEGKFYPNHAAAFLWRKIRNEYQHANNDALLKPILNNRLKSWSCKKNVLILCYDHMCQECEGNVMQKTNVAAIPRPKTTYPQQSVGHEINSPAANTEDSPYMRCMVIKYLYFKSDKFADHIVLVPSGQTWVYTLDEQKLEKNTSVAQAKKLVSVMDNLERICTFSFQESLVVVLKGMPDRARDMKTVSLNKSPEFFMRGEDWEILLEAVDRYNRTPGIKKIALHHDWRAWNNPNRLA